MCGCGRGRGAAPSGGAWQFQVGSAKCCCCYVALRAGESLVTASRSSPGRNGLMRYAEAPAAMPSYWSLAEARAVIINSGAECAEVLGDLQPVQIRQSQVQGDECRGEAA